MPFCTQCPHFDTEHEYDELGAKCLATYGALGDSSLYDLTHTGERCLCPGYEPEVTS